MISTQSRTYVLIPWDFQVSLTRDLHAVENMWLDKQHRQSFRLSSHFEVWLRSHLSDEKSGNLVCLAGLVRLRDVALTDFCVRAAAARNMGYVGGHQHDSQRESVCNHTNSPRIGGADRHEQTYPRRLASLILVTKGPGHQSASEAAQKQFSTARSQKLKWSFGILGRKFAAD